MSERNFLEVKIFLRSKINASFSKKLLNLLKLFNIILCGTAKKTELNLFLKFILLYNLKFLFLILEETNGS